MASEPIRFYHRYRRALEQEQIYGEGWLRFTYGNPVGKFFLWLLVQRKLFSTFYGWKMDMRGSARYVIPFIVKYDLDIDEFVKSPYDFKSFNEFFYRALKREARPIAPGDDVATFPADGRHLVFPDVDTVDGFYVKGAKFTLAELLGSEELGREYAGGAMVISRLCPVDYHRYHFSVAGVPTAPKLINGAYFSVSPIALRKNISYLVQNKRMLTQVQTERFGNVAVLEVAATNVGSIEQSFLADRPVSKGELKGFFKFGGSCVITVFAKGRIAFDADLVEQSTQFIETYAKMGDRLGVAR